MMKKILFSAAVIMAALTSCNKEEANVNAPETQDSKVWVEFTAGAATKAALAVVESENTIVWEENDAITVNGETLTTEESGSKVTFGGEVSDGFLAAETFAAIYPATAGTSFEEITVKSTQTAVEGGFDDIVAVAYSADQSLQFKHVTSLIKFQIPADFTVSTVTISADQELAGTVSVEMTDEEAVPAITVTEGVNEITLSGEFKADVDYYVAVLPGEKTNLTVRFDGYLSKTWAEANIIQGKIANMKELPAPVISDKYGIAATIQTPEWDAENPIPLYEDLNNTLVIKNVELYKDDAFKVVVDKGWDEAYGDNGNNFVVTKNGVFDIVFNASSKQITAICIEEYTDLMVSINIDNKANWTPLYIYLEVNGKAITPAEGELVSNNKYEISGDYIGSSISYKFISGDKESEMTSVPITQNGASISVEEIVVIFTFKLDTDNSKQWWGTAAKMHVWNTNTSFDTTWPGRDMIYDGDYTWHISIPSDLIGKTIDYKIHNGNGWESDNAKLEIVESGMTVKGSTINVN